MKVLVIGASRGIGLEFVRHYLGSGDAVTATARDDDGRDRLRELGAQAVALDVGSAESCARFAAQVEGPRFDIMLYVAGLYGPQTSGPEPPDDATFDAVMHVNVLGAMRLLAHAHAWLAPGARVAVLSSRMGSIGSRSSGSGWLYRASKAALNSVLKDASLALANHAVCVALHPGWVQTDMGGTEADLTPAASVASLRATIAALTAADNGRFLDHDGTPIPW